MNAVLILAAVGASLARTFDVSVLSDEIHGPLVLPGGTFTPCLTVPNTANGIRLHLRFERVEPGGAEAALVIAGPEAAEDSRRVSAELDYAPSHLGMLSHSAAFRDGGTWLDLIAGLPANLALLGNFPAEHLPQVSWTPPEGTFLAWLDWSLPWCGMEQSSTRLRSCHGH
jgi:cysteine-S-conjugate beta-lyase